MKKCLICKKQAYVLKQNLTYVPAEHKKFFKGKNFNYDILKCGSCGVEFQHPMPTKDVLRSLYSKSYDNPRASAEIVKLNAKKNIRILKKYGLTGRSKLLDYGCGDNYFVETTKDANWTGYDKYSMPIRLDNNYEFATLWGVLEHLTDPVKTMMEVIASLKKGGKVVITTVFSEFSGIPYQHKPPEHTFYFTRKSIEALFKKVGLRVLEYSPYFMYQKPEVYFWAVFNAARVPKNIQRRVSWDIKRNVFVPTNEVFVVGQKD